MNIGLDTPQGCLERLSEIDAEIEVFRVDAYKAAGQLARAEKEWNDRWLVAMRAIVGANAEVRKSLCFEAVNASYPGLAELIQELVGSMAEFNKRFDQLDTQRSIAQSCLKTHNLANSDQPGSRFAQPHGRQSS